MSPAQEQAEGPPVRNYLAVIPAFVEGWTGQSLRSRPFCDSLGAVSRSGACTEYYFIELSGSGSDSATHVHFQDTPFQSPMPITAGRCSMPTEHAPVWRTGGINSATAQSLEFL